MTTYHNKAHQLNTNFETANLNRAITKTLITLTALILSTSACQSPAKKMVETELQHCQESSSDVFEVKTIKGTKQILTVKCKAPIEKVNLEDQQKESFQTGPYLWTFIKESDNNWQLQDVFWPEWDNIIGKYETTDQYINNSLHNELNSLSIQDVDIRIQFLESLHAKHTEVGYIRIMQLRSMLIKDILQWLHTKNNKDTQPKPIISTTTNIQHNDLIEWAKEGPPLTKRHRIDESTFLVLSILIRTLETIDLDNHGNKIYQLTVKNICTEYDKGFGWGGDYAFKVRSLRFQIKEDFKQCTTTQYSQYKSPNKTTNSTPRIDVSSALRDLNRALNSASSTASEERIVQNIARQHGVNESDLRRAYLCESFSRGTAPSDCRKYGF